jgi:hypothetical protein
VKKATDATKLRAVVTELRIQGWALTREPPPGMVEFVDELWAKLRESDPDVPRPALIDRGEGNGWTVEAPMPAVPAPAR